MSYFKHIDGLRALAVLSVILVHLDFSLFSGGYVGVDIFFVISGFLITNIIVKELITTDNFSFLNFYTRRVRRIFPALIFTLFLSFVFSIWLLNVPKFNLYGGSLISSILSISNIFFYKTSGYFDIFSQSAPLLHTWSLGVEEQFYIFWPISLFIIFKANKNFILPFTILSIIVSLCWSIHTQDKNINKLFYLVQFRVFEFAIGACLVYLRNFKINKNIINELIFLIGLFLILFSVFTYDSNTLFPSYNALPPVIGSSLLIFSGTARFSGYLLRNNLFRFIGLISYSLYLIHWPIIVFVKTYNEDIGNDFKLSLIMKIIIIFISIFAASLMYYLIEKPFRKNIPKERKNQIKQFAIWVFVMIAFILIGISIRYYSNNWLWRVKGANNNTFENIVNYHIRNWGGADYFKGGLIYQSKNTSPDIILMGDSYSGMLDEGIVKKIAIPHDLTIFTASGGGAGKYASSLLLPGITRIGKNQQLFDKSAKEAYKEVLRNLFASKKSILIYSASYVDQIALAGHLENHTSLNIDTKSTSYNDYRPFTDSLDRLRILIKNHKLILIGDTPGSTFNAAQCVYELKWFSSKKCKSIDKKLNIKKININNVLQQYASKYDNVFFINPYNVFCEYGNCRNLDANGIPFYSDGYHLSKTGSNYLIENVKDKILDIYSNNN